MKHKQNTNGVAIFGHALKLMLIGLLRLSGVVLGWLSKLCGYLLTKTGELLIKIAGYGKGH